MTFEVFNDDEKKRLRKLRVQGRMPKHGDLIPVIDLLMKKEVVREAIEVLGFYLTPEGEEFAEAMEDAIAMWKRMRDAD